MYYIPFQIRGDYINCNSYATILLTCTHLHLLRSPRTICILSISGDNYDRRSTLLYELKPSILGSRGAY